MIKRSVSTSNMNYYVFFRTPFQLRLLLLTVLLRRLLCKKPVKTKSDIG